MGEVNFYQNFFLVRDYLTTKKFQGLRLSFCVAVLQNNNNSYDPKNLNVGRGKAVMEHFLRK